MKYEKILLFSSIALPAVVLMRFLQLFFTVDVKTGFFKSEYEDAGRCLLVLIALGCAAVAVLCLTSHRNPENPPKKNLVTAVFSFITAAVTAIEIFSESFAGTVMRWQSSLLMLMGLAAAAFFVAYGISLISDFTLPPISAVIPVFYFIIKVICVFTSVSSLALITVIFSCSRHTARCCSSSCASESFITESTANTISESCRHRALPRCCSALRSLYRTLYSTSQTEGLTATPLTYPTFHFWHTVFLPRRLPLPIFRLKILRQVNKNENAQEKTPGGKA